MNIIFLPRTFIQTKYSEDILIDVDLFISKIETATMHILIMYVQCIYILICIYNIYRQ